MALLSLPFLNKPYAPVITNILQGLIGISLLTSPTALAWALLHA